ncbi:semaphorin-4C-like [Petromyzon marinus]|uniref:semaphorin-4C-like n=1 Tax=Petromyzon marinus TaxID=7757 RepID=UPI003F71C2A6
MGTVPALVLVLGVLRVAAEGPLVPRVSFSYEELVQEEAMSFRAVPDASALLLVPQRSALYVGARDAILALDARNVSRELHPALSWTADSQMKTCQSKRNSQWECFNFVRVLHRLDGTRLYACGTGAFQPKCAYINVADFSFVKKPGGTVMEEDGKGKCPFDPEQRHTSLMTGGELYSGTGSNYLGSESVVQRSPSSMSSELSSSWLYNPTFVASEFVNESESREQDNKVYFFFSETAVEFDFYSRVVVPRVARVCTGDTGGLKKLEKKWTTFLKARLDCSLREMAFTGLRHVVSTRGLRGRPDTVFYALYTDRRGGGAVSAVCSYRMDEVQRVFSGSFKHQGGADQRWAPYAGALPAQRPGDCPLGWDSQMLPSETLNFVSDHPLMDEAVKAEGGRPWLLVPGVAYNRLLVVDVAALDGKSWRTLLLGTDAGALHRAVLPESRGDPHLVEELQALGQQEPVVSMVLTHDQTSVVVAGPAGVVQLSVCRCGRYRACWDCVLARDPCCAWDPQQRLCRRHGGETGTGSWLLDVSGGDATTLCSAHPPDVVAVRVALAPLLLLPCSPPSRLARLSWERDSGPAPGQPLPEAGLLLRQGAPPAPRDLTGTYLCWAEEGGHWRLVASYTVQLPGSSSSSSSSTTTTSSSVTKRKSNRQQARPDPTTGTAATSESAHVVPGKDASTSDSPPGFGPGFLVGLLVTVVLVAAGVAVKRRFFPKAAFPCSPSADDVADAAEAAAAASASAAAASSNGRATTEPERGGQNGDGGGPGDNANGNNNVAAGRADGDGAGDAPGEEGDEEETQKPLLVRLESLQRSSEA